MEIVGCQKYGSSTFLLLPSVFSRPSPPLLYLCPLESCILSSFHPPSLSFFPASPFSIPPLHLLLSPRPSSQLACRCKHPVPCFPTLVRLLLDPTLGWNRLKKKKKKKKTPPFPHPFAQKLKTLLSPIGALDPARATLKPHIHARNVSSYCDFFLSPAGPARPFTLPSRSPSCFGLFTPPRPEPHTLLSPIGTPGPKSGQISCFVSLTVRNVCLLLICHVLLVSCCILSHSHPNKC